MCCGSSSILKRWAHARVRLWTVLGTAWEVRCLTRLGQWQAGDSLSVDIGGTRVTLVKLRSALGLRAASSSPEQHHDSPGPPQASAGLGQSVCLASVQG